MYFDTIEVAPLMTNCYLIGDEGSGECAVVDPGGSPDRVLDMIRRSGMKPAMVLLTHGHYDHVRAVPAVLAVYPDLPVYIHEAELCPAEDVRARYQMPHKGANQRTYGEGDVLTLGSNAFQVLHTPGHSPGSVTLLTGDVMLCGDTLFAGTCGRWDLPGGDGEALMASLARLGRLERDYKVCPGHGGASTLDRERQTNEYMREALGE